MWWKHGFLKATWENYGSPLHDPGALALEASKALLCRNPKRVVFQLKGTEVGEGETFPGGRVSKRKQSRRMGQLTNNYGCGPGLGFAFHKAVEKPSLGQPPPPRQ